MIEVMEARFIVSSSASASVSITPKNSISTVHIKRAVNGLLVMLH